MVSDAEWANVRQALSALEGKTILTLQGNRPNHILCVDRDKGFLVRTEPPRGGGTRQIGWRDITKGYYLIASAPDEWFGNPRPSHRNFGGAGAFVMALLATLTTVEKSEKPRKICYIPAGRPPRLRPGSYK